MPLSTPIAVRTRQRLPNPIISSPLPATRNADSQVPEAKQAYQTLVALLFKHIDDVAASNPKYEHIVKLENYHFFAATTRPLKVCTSSAMSRLQRTHRRGLARQLGGARGSL